jgi:LuxR family quorum-sensing system transcriptional regulator CciR
MTMLIEGVETAIEQIDQAISLDELHRSIIAAKIALGFCYYAFIQSNSGRSIDGLLLQDYPDSWIKLQSDTYGFAQSPILQLASQTATPFEWCELPALMTMTQGHSVYLRLATAHGLGQGYTVPIHAPGEASALVSFVSPADWTIDPSSFPFAVYVAARAFSAGSRIRRAAAEQHPRLSDSDAKVITLVCRGHSKRCIAQKLGIDASDVNRAVLRGCKHYRVGSQTEMIVHALYERSIRFEDVIR